MIVRVSRVDCELISWWNNEGFKKNERPTKAMPLGEFLFVDSGQCLS